MHKNSIIKLYKKYKGKIVKLSFDFEDYIKFSYICIISQTGAEGRVTVGQCPTKYAHREALKYNGSLKVDHIDGNPFNNTKTNLRITSAQNNCFNTRAHSDSKYSKYKGVSFWKHKNYKRTKSWLAQIKCGEVSRKAYFATEIEAAAQYNEWAKELHKEFAVLNDI